MPFELISAEPGVFVHPAQRILAHGEGYTFTALLAHAPCNVGENGGRVVELIINKDDAPTDDPCFERNVSYATQPQGISSETVAESLAWCETLPSS